MTLSPRRLSSTPAPVAVIVAVAIARVLAVGIVVAPHEAVAECPAILASVTVAPVVSLGAVAELPVSFVIETTTASRITAPLLHTHVVASRVGPRLPLDSVVPGSDASGECARTPRCHGDHSCSEDAGDESMESVHDGFPFFVSVLMPSSVNVLGMFVCALPNTVRALTIFPCRPVYKGRKGPVKTVNDT